jgi:isopentenyl-diphosphate delta-isomerase
MPVKTDSDTSRRKQEHIDLCLNEDVSFKEKTNGFDKYEFIHDPITEVNISKLKFKTNFLKKNIDFPFLISCMTGGTAKAGNINTQLSIAANELNIALGVGSQRQALENSRYIKTYKTIRKNAPNIPILGNIGASQIVKLKSFNSINYLVDLIEADAMVIHLNPAQELFQKKGQPNFAGLVRKIQELVKHVKIPIIVKEVGSGISGTAARVLLNAGVYGIDVAGAGGTSWTGVEMLRNKNKRQKEFWDWGVPTSFCIQEVYKLKKSFNFVLIGSGGINNSFDMAKAYTLGADITASARRILIELDKKGTEGVIRLIKNWFEDLKKIMFLTGSNSIIGLRKNKLMRKEDIY